MAFIAMIYHELLYYELSGMQVQLPLASISHSGPLYID